MEGDTTPVPLFFAFLFVCEYIDLDKNREAGVVSLKCDRRSDTEQVSKPSQDVPSTAKLKCPPGLGAGVVS